MPTVFIVLQSTETASDLKQRLEARGYPVHVGSISVQSLEDVSPDVLIGDALSMSGLVFETDIPRVIVSTGSIPDVADRASESVTSVNLELPCTDRELLYAIEIAQLRCQLTGETTRIKHSLSRRYETLELEIEDRTAELQMAFDLMKNKANKLKRSNEKLEHSLQERNKLLKEMHDRVKDNLQLICSLVGLQVVRTDHPGLAHELNAIISRVKAMSLAYEVLYQSKNFTQVDAQKYLSKLLAGIIEIYIDMSEQVKVEKNIDPFQIDLEVAIPLGIIINEVMGNSFSFGYPNDRSGRISLVVSCNDDSVIDIRIQDDGIGLPAEKIDQLNERPRTLGLNLVKNLVESNLEGTCTFSSENGLRVDIQFKLET